MRSIGRAVCEFAVGARTCARVDAGTNAGLARAGTSAVVSAGPANSALDVGTSARTAALGCALLLWLGGMAGAAQAAPTITEYNAGNVNYAQPLSVLDAPSESDADGALWFTVNESSPGFGIMTVSGQLEKLDEEEPLLSLLGSTDPRELALGPEGDLWVTENGTDPMIRWGNPTKSPYFPKTLMLAAGSDPVGIAAGPGGEMWFTEGDGTGKVVKLSPTTGKVTGEYSAGLLSGGEPAQIVAGPGGDMWFAEHGAAGAIGKITPSGEITLFQTGLTSDSGPWGVTLGLEGDIWFTEYSPSGKIGRITPSGQITEFSGSTDGEPGEIVTGDDGDMYFTERGSEKKSGHEGAIAEVTPSGEIDQFMSGLTAANTPWAIATGPDGDIWFTELGEAKIGRLTIPPGIADTSNGTPGEAEAKLEAKVLPNAQSSTLSFEYWPTSASASSSSSVGVGTGTSASPGSVQLSGLTPGTTYHYRAVAQNASGTTDGPEETFTTASPPTPPSGPPTGEGSSGEGSGGKSSGEGSGEKGSGGGSSGGTQGEDSGSGGAPSGGGGSPGQTGEQAAATSSATGDTDADSAGADEPDAGPLSVVLGPGELAHVATAPPAGAAPPVLGRSGVVGVTTGTVTWLDPHTGLYEPVSAATDLPFGTSIDAQNGVVALTTALPGGHTQTAQVWGGTFWFAQSSHGDGQTELYLSGPLGPCPAGAGAAGASASGARASAARERAKRQLWSKDSHGHYTTHGANSAATVLGTEWLTVDSCTGTLTRVREGRVRVRDLHTGRATIVSTGHSYLARS